MSDTLQFVEPWIKGGQNITLTLAPGYLTKKRAVVFNETTN